MLQWKSVEQLKAYLKTKQRNEKNTSIPTHTTSKFVFAVFSYLVYVVTELRFEEKNTTVINHLIVIIFHYFFQINNEYITHT